MQVWRETACFFKRNLERDKVTTNFSVAGQVAVVNFSALRTTTYVLAKIIFAFN